MEYNDNYSKMSWSLLNYYRDEANDSANENYDANNYWINKNKTVINKSFKYKKKVIENTSDNNNRLNPEVGSPLKYLSNFWRSLDLPLINCEIELDLSWSRYCVITEKSRTPAVLTNPNANPPVSAVEKTQITSVAFQIKNAKLYVPVVTLSINNRIKAL